MRKSVFLGLAALPLAACATSPYGSPYGYGYNDPLTTVIGALGTSYAGGGYGPGFSQAAASACANYAARYGAPRVTNVRQASSSRMKVYGYVSDGYRSNNWDCTFRSDGRITDFDL
jgi:hypothetical protein